MPVMLLVKRTENSSGVQVIMALYSEYFENKNTYKYFSLPFFEVKSLTDQCPITTDKLYN